MLTCRHCGRVFDPDALRQHQSRCIERPATKPERPAEPRTGAGKGKGATEEAEQRTVAAWLDMHRVLYTHVPNGGDRNAITGAKLKAQGVKRGVPDLLIFDPPVAQAILDSGATLETLAPSYIGLAIEMKRQKGGRISSEQEAWQGKLAKRSWYVAVCHGADEAIKLLEALGYGGRK